MADSATLDALRSLPLFAGCADEHLVDLAATLTPRRVEAGETLLSQGETADWFAVVCDGEAEVFRHEAGETLDLGEAGPGSIVGELALLRGTPRNATVIARTPLDVLLGARDAFAALLDIEGVRERVVKLASQKLASQVTSGHATMKDGRPFELRPLLPSDRVEMAEEIRRLSDETRRRRFFTGGMVPERTLDYLVDLDYIDHFAWLAIDIGGDRRGMGVSRFVRLHDEPEVAEFAVTVGDDYQRQHVGRQLLGAIAAAARAAGVQVLEGNALGENLAIQRLLEPAGAHWRVSEPGVVTARVAVDDVIPMIDDDLVHQLTGSAAAAMAAARVPLTRPRQAAGRDDED